jgi:phosphonate transport system permease protein
MIGIVGAGGIGGTLFAAFQRFDYDFVCAILIAIIALIMLAEILSNFVRALFTENVSVVAWLKRQAPEKRDRALGSMEGA